MNIEKEKQKNKNKKRRKKTRSYPYWKTWRWSRQANLSHYNARSQWPATCPTLRNERAFSLKTTQWGWPTWSYRAAWPGVTGWRLEISLQVFQFSTSIKYNCQNSWELNVIILCLISPSLKKKTWNLIAILTLLFIVRLCYHPLISGKVCSDPTNHRSLQPCKLLLLL